MRSMVEGPAARHAFEGSIPAEAPPPRSAVPLPLRGRN